MQLSVVLPARNEEGSIALVLGEVLETLDRHRLSGEAIVVDDGSTDGTAAAVSALRDPRVRLLRLERNLGRAGAIAHGFASAAGEALVVMDSDGQYDPEDIVALLAALRGADVANGVRRVRADPASRRLVSGVYNLLLMRAALGVTARDANSGLKAFRASAMVRLSFAPGGYHRAHRLLIAAAQGAGLRIVDVPVAHRPRSTGRSYIRPLREARLTVSDVVRFRRTLRAARRGADGQAIRADPAEVAEH